MGEVKSLPTLKSKYKGQEELLHLEAIISRALKFGIGNCDELTALTVMFLLEYPETGFDDLPKLDEPVTIESVSLNLDFPNDHAFIILNRESVSILNDINTWNDDVVICDPWSREVYNKAEFLKKMDVDTQKFMIEKFKSISKNVLVEGCYYIGEQHNKRIHTDYWYKKPTVRPWHPHRILDLQALPSYPESLPKMERAIKPLKLSFYSLDLIEDAKQIPEFFELFGGLQSAFSFKMDNEKDKLMHCLNGLQKSLVTHSPPYVFPLLLNINDGQDEKSLVFYQHKWLCFDGKNKIVVDNLTDVISAVNTFAINVPSPSLTFSLYRANKDLNRATVLLQPWYDTFSKFQPQQRNQL